MIIGFTGKMGSGKSTAIATIKEAEGIQGRPVFNVKFAQPLYDIQEYVYDRIKSVYRPPANFIKDRKLLQWVGTEWGRENISQTLWVDLWRARVQEILSSTYSAIVVCDDVRFDNEAALVKSLGGLVVRVYGHGIANTGISEHASESGISDSLVDFSLPNTGNIGDFKSTVINFHRDFLAREQTRGAK